MEFGRQLERALKLLGVEDSIFLGRGKIIVDAAHDSSLDGRSNHHRPSMGSPGCCLGQLKWVGWPNGKLSTLWCACRSLIGCLRNPALTETEGAVREPKQSSIKENLAVPAPRATRRSCPLSNRPRLHHNLGLFGADTGCCHSPASVEMRLRS